MGSFLFGGGDGILPSRMSVEILGVHVHTLAHESVMSVIDELLRSPVPRYIVTVNPEFIMAAQSDREFLRILNEADLALADGIGLLWAASLLAEPFSIAATKNPSARMWWCLRTAALKACMLLLFPRWLQSPIRQRVSGSDLVPELVAKYQDRAVRVALIGGRGGTAQQAANVLVERYPRAHIVLADPGIECSIDSEGRLRYDRQQQQRLLERIAAAKPDIVFVGFGQRKQEKWIAESFRHLSGVNIFMGVGGTFDMIAGTTARAPRFFRTRGMEWIWRWMLEPWRAGRMMTATIRFMSRVITEKYQSI